METVLTYTKNYDRNISYILNKLENADCHKENIKVVVKFCEEKLASDFKTGSVVNTLKVISRIVLAFNKPFTEITKEDLVAFFNTLKPDYVGFRLPNGEYYKNEKEEYSDVTVIRMKGQTKTFWKWLADNNKNIQKNETGIPLAVSWIKSTNKIKNHKFQKNVLAREEVLQMIKSTPKSRNKALIAILFETGMRASELLGMKRNEIEFYDDYCEFVCNGKTGERPVVLIQSFPYLRQWLDFLDIHQEKIPKIYQNHVWLTYSEFGKKAFSPLSKGALSAIVKYVGNRAGIKKRVWTHGFRHASATDFAKQGYNEVEMRLKYGWTPTSNIPSQYIHYKHEELKNKQLFNAGKNVEKPQTDGKMVLTKSCPFCSYENPAENQYCGKCSKPMDIKTIKQMEKSQAAYQFISNLLEKAETLEKKGVSLQRINEALDEWVKE